MKLTICPNTSQAVQPHAAPTTFHSYPKLPLELKYMIWEHTLPTEPRVTELERASWGDIHKYGYSVEVSSLTPDSIKVALSVDRASRAVVFRNYIPLKLGMRIAPAEYGKRYGERSPRNPVAEKWLIPRRTIFMSERLGDIVVAKSREVLVFPYRPARHGLDIVTTTHICSPSWEVIGVGDEARVYGLGRDTKRITSTGALLEFFEEWWACLPQQEERDSSPVGWEAEIDFWNSLKEHDIPYILEFKGRKPGACRRLVKN